MNWLLAIRKPAGEFHVSVKRCSGIFKNFSRPGVPPIPGFGAGSDRELEIFELLARRGAGNRRGTRHQRQDERYPPRAHQGEAKPAQRAGDDPSAVSGWSGNRGLAERCAPQRSSIRFNPGIPVHPLHRTRIISGAPCRLSFSLMCARGYRSSDADASSTAISRLPRPGPATRDLQFTSLSAETGIGGRWSGKFLKNPAANVFADVKLPAALADGSKIHRCSPFS